MAAMSGGADERLRTYGTEGGISARIEEGREEI